MSDETSVPLPRIQVSAGQAVRIVAPYFRDRMWEQLVSVVPIVLFMAVFQRFALGRSIEYVGVITGGVLVVMVGLMLFMEGIRIGLMPVGETLGRALPVSCSLPVTLAFSLVLGFLATLAEPAVGAIRSAGAGVDPVRAPLLYSLLNDHSVALVFAIGGGVAMGALIGTLRFLYNWRLGPFIFPIVGLCLGLSFLALRTPETATLIGVAWDCGAVVAGPVNAPLLLALGVGICSAMGRSDTGMSGFGVLALACLLPAVTVLSLGLGLYYLGGFDPAQVHAAAAAQAASSSGPDVGGSAMQALWDAVKAIGMLSAFLLLFQKFVVRQALQHVPQIALGIALALVGLTLFNLGIYVGLIPLGDQVGLHLPKSFHPAESAIFGETGGRIVVIAFSFALGYLATLAEPAFSALGTQVEEITTGAFKKKLLVHAVSLGVGIGMAFGATKLVYGLPLSLLLLIPYLGVLAMTFGSKEEFINIAYDSSAATTGPVTVPLVIAMGLAITGSIRLTEGFGVLSLASLWPIVTVLTVGFLVARGRKRKEAKV